MKDIQAETACARVDAAGNKMLEWQVSNVDLDEDTHENIRPIKTSELAKIDAAVALIMAREAAKLDDPEFASMHDDDDTPDPSYEPVVVPLSRVAKSREPTDEDPAIVEVEPDTDERAPDGEFEFSDDEDASLYIAGDDYDEA